MYGLKRVSQRRDDALSRVGWEQLEALLATYYRGRGYQVDHVGTGASGTRFDGGIDLKLRRDSEYILVQCKHWNAMKVTHNAVHELLGLMVNEGATGAILVTSGEFSKAAIEAGTRQGHVQLIDGEELRAMIGPVPEPDPVVVAPSIMESELTPMLRARNSGKQTSTDESSGLVWKIAGGVILGLLAFNMIGNVVDSYRQRKAMEMFAQEMKRIAADPDPLGWRAAAAARQRTSSQTTTAIPKSPQAATEPYQAPAPRPQTQAEIREARWRSEEAMKIIEDSTPEL